MRRTRTSNVLGLREPEELPVLSKEINLLGKGKKKEILLQNKCSKNSNKKKKSIPRPHDSVTGKKKKNTTYT